MAEQTFRSPGFFEQELDLSARSTSAIGTPAGVIGTAIKGPAFVPVTIGSFGDFETRFGTLDPDRFGPYAVREFLKFRDAVTYVRVLGAGANDSVADISTTQTQGTVRNAGFSVAASADADTVGGYLGAVQLLTAEHGLRSDVGGAEAAGYPLFTDNSSFEEKLGLGATSVNLVRAVLFTPTGSRFEVLDHDQDWATHAAARDAVATFGGGVEGHGGYFKLALSSSESGNLFANDEGVAGVRIYTASLDPANKNYIGKILNTDPTRFQEEEHLLYLDFAVENELAYPVHTSAGVALLSGSDATSTTSGNPTVTMRDLFGRYDTRYTTPLTPSIISQPYGGVEYDLFHFECISDGAATNKEYKASIANIRKSTDPNNRYGTFDVQIRRFDDNDLAPEILEYYPDCNLNPSSENYVARKIGDRKVYYNFDAEDIDERRLVVKGKYPNASNHVRIVMSDELENDEVPADALPFGFRGIPVLKTSDSLTDAVHNVLSTDNTSTTGGDNSITLGDSRARLADISADTTLTGSIVPPLPLRFKVTRGQSGTGNSYTGEVGENERADARFYWGVKFERLPVTSSAEGGSIDNAIMNTNISAVPNPVIDAYAKFQGIAKLDALVTGTAADEFNDNKFTLSRVALYNAPGANDPLADVTGSAKDHMKEAAYIRNAAPATTDGTISDTGGTRVTMATIVHNSPTVFNRFQQYNKFNVMFYGGYDGVNILDQDNSLLLDKAASSDAGGKAGDSFTGGLGLVGTNNGVMSGKGKKNNIVNSYRVASKILTDPMASNVNILSIPGIRDTFVTDYALDATRDYGMAIYLMDLIKYDSDGNRLFDDSEAKPDVRETAEQFESRAINNNYGATYFPDVDLDDPIANRPVRVPASVAALGATAYNDSVSYPWFAPAGFNRGALTSVTNLETRLNSPDRDVLYDARINPIATFPRAGFVIFGQKTLQQAKSALDRINVRRMLLEVKRLVKRIAQRLLFEQNDSATRARFVSQVSPQLALVQSQAGVERFRVICDDTNNTPSDVDANRMNGRIVVVPTKAVEFISVDFVVTNSGVSFE